MGETFAEIVTSGPLLLGVVVALVAGLVSFLSPCILPLVPGYVAYVTGLSAADLAGDATHRPSRREPAMAAGDAGPGDAGPGDAARAGATDTDGAASDRAAVGTATDGHRRPAVQRRVLLGGLLFIAGFGTVFVTGGVLAASVGRALHEYQRILEVAGGALMLVFALALLGLVPGMQRELRLRWLPTAGLAGAPVFGAVFALSWIPCIGPTIGAVLALGALGGEPGRAAVLASAYTLGIGLPFLAFGLGFRWALGLVALVRRHAVWVMRAGAVLLATVGLALLTGAWDGFVLWLQTNVGVGEVSL